MKLTYIFFGFIVIFTIIIITNKPGKYSWKDFNKRFGYIRGPVTFYDLSQCVDDEQNYKSHRENITYSKLLNKEHREENSTGMIKIVESKCTPSEMKLINYVKPVIKNSNNADTMLRIQTSPWLYSAHFDCFDQFVYMLYGSKKWLIFNITFDDMEEEKRFIISIANKSIKEVSVILNSKNISYETRITKPGDTLFIPEGVYHLVESIGRGGTIMANSRVDKPEDKNLIEKFYYLWPVWFNRKYN